MTEAACVNGRDQPSGQRVAQNKVLRRKLIFRSRSPDARIHKPIPIRMQAGGQPMIYGRPVIHVLNSLDVFFERLLVRTVPPHPDTDWRAKKLKELIDTDQGKVRWRLGDACKELGFPMSDRQARRLFKASMGVGIKEYSLNRRLGCAAEQLRGTNAPIKAIAVEVGYQTTGHFARSFKELFCVTPMEFRRIWRLKEVAA